MARGVDNGSRSAVLREMAGRMSARGMEDEANILRGIAEEVCDHRLMTLQEAAAFCRIPVKEFARLVDAGHIDCRYFGDEPRFDVRRLLA